MTAAYNMILLFVVKKYKHARVYIEQNIFTVVIFENTTRGSRMFFTNRDGYAAHNKRGEKVPLSLDCSAVCAQ